MLIAAYLGLVCLQSCIRVYMLMHTERERERERESERETVLELAGEKGRDGGGVGLLMYEALGYSCIRPYATGV